MIITNTLLFGLIISTLARLNLKTRNAVRLGEEMQRTIARLRETLGHLDYDQIKETCDRVIAEHQQISHELKHAEHLRTELSAFVNHGDQVIDRMDKLIRGIGRDK
jgi:uncharacterized protein with HEPN domain